MQKRLVRIIILIFGVLVGYSCASQKKMAKKAELAFSNGEYFKAVDLYVQLAEDEQSKYIKSSYESCIAECYRHLNESKKAEVAYKKVEKNKSTKDKTARYWYGYF